MYRTFLSLRYLRTRRINWLGTVGITVSVGALITILSIMTGFIDESRNTIRGSLADVVIQPRFDALALLPDGSRKPLEQDSRGALEIIRRHDFVAGACVQLQWYGMLSHATTAGRVMGTTRNTNPLAEGLGAIQLVGIDLEDELQTTALGEALVAPKKHYMAVSRVEDPSDPFALPSGYVMAEDDFPPVCVLVGEQLAASWGLYSGDTIEVYTAVPDPETGAIDRPSNQSFVIAGTFRTGDNETDMGRVYMERRELQRFLPALPRYTSILTRLHDYERDKDRAVRELQAALAEGGHLHDPLTDRDYREVRTWEGFRQNILRAIENEKFLLGIMLCLVLVVAGFTIFAILSMTVTEKRRDIGILCALGATDGGVMSMFLMLGLWEAIVGSVAGSVIGVTLAANIDRIEQWLSAVLGIKIFDRNVYLFDHLPSRTDPSSVALIVGGAFLCTLISAALPAWRAARLDPIEALRYE